MNYSHIVAARIWADRALEFSWLAAVVLVPLITLPDSAFVATVGPAKTATLRIIASVAVIAWLLHGVLWLTARSLFPVIEPASDTAANRSFSERARPYLSQPHAWLILSVATLALVTLFSTLLSIDPSVSTWGKLAGSEGYGLYSTAALLVLFFTVAFKLRTNTQLWRLVNVMAIVGVLSALIGIGQSLNIWPEQNNVYHNRVPGHSGNPIAYGGLMLLFYPITVAAVLRFGLRDPSWSRLWLPLLVVSFMLMYSVALTLSRGPFIGMAIGMLVLVVMVAWAAGARFGLRFAGITVLSALLVGLLIAGLDQLSVSEPVTPDEEFAAGPSVDERLTTSGTVERRLQIWSASRELVIDRPAVPGTSGADTAISRHLFGYGPDQFRYVFGLTAESDTFYSTVSEAHNDLIHRLVETGWLGLLAFGSILLSVLLILVRFVVRSRRSGDAIMALLAAALMAGFAGRFIELQFGVARNSDLVIFWIMAGAVAAMPIVLRAPAERSPGKPELRSLTPLFPKPGIAVGYGFGVVLAIFAVSLISAGAWQKNVNHVRADNSGQLALNSWSEDPRRAAGHLQDATELAPDVAAYWIALGDLYSALAENSLNQQEKLTLLQAGHEADLRALEVNPLERDANFHVAESAWEMAIQGDAPDKAIIAVERYEFLSEIAPDYLLVRERLARISDALQAS